MQGAVRFLVTNPTQIYEEIFHFENRLTFLQYCGHEFVASLSWLTLYQVTMYCILTKYTVADQMLKFGGGHMFLGGFTAAGDKKIG